MERCFTQSFAATLSTSAEVTGVTIVGGAAVVVGVYDFVVSCFGDTPADETALWEIRRFTAGGTAGSTPTPIKCNPNSPAAAAATNGVATFTVEPTYTDLLFRMAVHQRAIGRFWAFDGRELYATAASGNGVGAVSDDAGAAVEYQGSIFWKE